MKKPETIYTCVKCDAQTSKWSGRCLECGAWGGLREADGTQNDAETERISAGKPGQIKSFQTETPTRAEMKSTRLKALDDVLGGGLVDGSVTLLAGEPGIGKSTILAQTAIALAASGLKVVYVTGEESPAQIHRRLERLATPLPSSLFFLDETDAGTVAATISKEQPGLTIVDSIQTLRTAEVGGEPGNLNQVKASAALVTEAAKYSHAPVILVGQVTKDNEVAGPRVLEHLVDTVLYLEGDRQHRYRMLRALKHRFGPTDEVALLAMTERGLEIVEDPSSELLRDRAMGIAGSAVSCLIEGHRPLLIEIQALASPAGYGTPIRRATGVDTSRLGMLLAVLARRAGVNALDKDVYANAAGGIDARDPSVDLALAAAIAGAVKNVALDPRTAIFGEIGLGGELRPVSMPEIRLKELARMGFKTVVMPKRQSGKPPAGLDIKEASTLDEALRLLGL
ncbi:DNA repair protein RadA [Candidatus Uhrbacteria bacterium]|nr:DNA repair protein RadA [Candidatus Uhrbacteria bacterium]